MKYQIDQSGKIENTGKQMMLISNYLATKKSAFADLVHLTDSLNGWIDTLSVNLQQSSDFVKSQDIMGVDPSGIGPDRFGVSIQPSEPAEPTPESVSHFDLQSSIIQKKPADKVLSLKEILVAIKKTDERLRECLTTLVGVQPRSMNRYYQPKNKKSRPI